MKNFAHPKGLSAPRSRLGAAAAAQSPPSGGEEARRTRHREIRALLRTTRESLEAAFRRLRADDAGA